MSSMFADEAKRRRVINSEEGNNRLQGKTCIGWLNHQVKFDLQKDYTCICILKKSVHVCFYGMCMHMCVCIYVYIRIPRSFSFYVCSNVRLVKLGLKMRSFGGGVQNHDMLR